MTKEELLNLIDSKVYTNGQQKITGGGLNEVLKGMVNSGGSGESCPFIIEMYDTVNGDLVVTSTTTALCFSPADSSEHGLNCKLRVVDDSAKLFVEPLINTIIENGSKFSIAVVDKTNPSEGVIISTNNLNLNKRELAVEPMLVILIDNNGNQHLYSIIAFGAYDLNVD